MNKLIKSLPPLEGYGALLDTSAIIDARIAQVAETGFAPQRLIVPLFVLVELQNIADSRDPLRRERGQRGLEALKSLRASKHTTIFVVDDDIEGIPEVDAKLVALAQTHHLSILTTDYNLNRVAEIQDVAVLNINQLASAMRPIVVPGEELVVRIVQPGRESQQGVGYLDDGTMIVVDNGLSSIGQEVITEVTRVLQTVAGKMIFAILRNPPLKG